MEREEFSAGLLLANEIRVKKLLTAGDPENGDAGTPDVAGATITVGTQAGNVINVAVQLTDGDGDDVSGSHVVRTYLSDAATGLGLAGTAPTTSPIVGTDGEILVVDVVDKMLTMETETDGEFDLDIEDSGTPTFYLVVVLPNGRKVVSDAITFA